METWFIVIYVCRILCFYLCVATKIRIAPVHYMYMIATKGNMLRPPKIMCEESQGKISLTAICAFGFCSLVVGGHSARPLGIVFCKSRQTLAKQAIYAGFPGNLRDFLSPPKKASKIGGSASQKRCAACGWTASRWRCKPWSRSSQRRSETKGWRLESIRGGWGTCGPSKYP